MFIFAPNSLVNVILWLIMYLAPGFAMNSSHLDGIQRPRDKDWLDCELMINLPSAWLKNCAIAHPCLYGFLAEGLSYREKTENDTSWPLSVWWPSGSSPLVSNVPREGSRHSDLVYVWSFYIFQKVSLNCPYQTRTYGQISFPNTFFYLVPIFFPLLTVIL